MTTKRTEWQSKQGKASLAAVAYSCAVSGRRIESKFQNPALVDLHPPGL